MRYRPEIDGLRAVSVLAIFLFISALRQVDTSASMSFS